MLNFKIFKPFSSLTFVEEPLSTESSEKNDHENEIFCSSGTPPYPLKERAAPYNLAPNSIYYESDFYSSLLIDDADCMFFF